MRRSMRRRGCLMIRRRWSVVLGRRLLVLVRVVHVSVSQLGLNALDHALKVGSRVRCLMRRCCIGRVSSRVRLVRRSAVGLRRLGTSVHSSVPSVSSIVSFASISTTHITVIVIITITVSSISILTIIGPRAMFSSSSKWRPFSSSLLLVSRAFRHRHTQGSSMKIFTIVYSIDCCMCHLQRLVPNKSRALRSAVGLFQKHHFRHLTIWREDSRQIGLHHLMRQVSYKQLGLSDLCLSISILYLKKC